MINSHFHHAISVIEQRTGLAVAPQRRAEITTLLTELAGGEMTAFLRHLRTEPLTTPTWQGVVRALAIGETYFFRDEAQFNALRIQILPQLIQQRRQQQQLTLSLWSVGCATGEEPYSLAILLKQLLPDINRWKIHLIATDINQLALDAAQRAVYRAWSFRQSSQPSPPSFDISTYFDTVDDGQKLKSALRHMVKFHHANILDGIPAFIASELGASKFDIVLCRNVLLYFSPEQAVSAEAVLREALAPSGWLFLGHSEMLRHERHTWHLNRFPGIPIYQRAPETEIPTPLTLTSVGVNMANNLQPGSATPMISPAPHPSVTLASTASQLYAEAVAAYHHERPNDAESLLRRLLDLQPDHPQGLTLLACLYADRQTTDTAHQTLDRVLRLDPLAADAHYLRAMLHREDGQPDAVEHALRAALYCDRDHILAGYWLGTLYAQAGAIPRALRQFDITRQALHTSARSPDAYVSDISSLTIRRMIALLDEQLAAWKN